MDKPDAKRIAALTLCLMVALPMTFLALYPLAYVLLPEALQRVADLPQDLTLVILFSDVLLPVCSLWLYGRARRRHRHAATRLREKFDTRDVL